MNGAKKDAQLLSATNVRALFDSVDAFLFDCDGSFLFSDHLSKLRSAFSDLNDDAGVIWKGDMFIDGVPQTLEMLRSKVLFSFSIVYI